MTNNMFLADYDAAWKTPCDVCGRSRIELKEKGLTVAKYAFYHGMCSGCRTYVNRKKNAPVKTPILSPISGKKERMKNQFIVQETTDYAKFKDITGNRVINQNHLKKLLKEIQMNNLLQTQPILVNEKMQVIDGQHRLEAAKELQLPIFYTVVNGLSIKHVVRLNNAQRAWKLEDYVDMHIALGNQNYVALRAFIHEFGVTPTQAIMLLGRTSSSTTGLPAFREGDFQILNEEGGREVAEIAHDLHAYLLQPIIATEGAFTRALLTTQKVLNLQDKPLKLLVIKIQEAHVLIPYGRRRVDYLKTFEDILNINQKKDLIRLY